MKTSEKQPCSSQLATKRFAFLDTSFASGGPRHVRRHPRHPFSRLQQSLSWLCSKARVGEPGSPYQLVYFYCAVSLGIPSPDCNEPAPRTNSMLFHWYLLVSYGVLMAPSGVLNVVLFWSLADHRVRGHAVWSCLVPRCLLSVWQERSHDCFSWLRFVRSNRR